jgi:ACT domain-containing protein
MPGLTWSEPLVDFWGGKKKGNLSAIAIGEVIHGKLQDTFIPI